jgi:hypothetical protein
MPYAAKATIQHEYEGTTLYIWITFALPMKLSSNPLEVPPVFDIKPPDAKWIVKLDDVLTTITSSTWLDLYTMLLTIESVFIEPNKVTVQYDGPDTNLRTVWCKQWEPWAAIESYTGWPTTFKAGMIILWHGSVVSIPSGWHLCDGNEGTPDLRDKFVVGAGNTYNPDTTGGVSAHAHTTQPHGHNVYIQDGADIAAGGDYDKIATSDAPAVVVNSTNTLPPYYALCYIMKL